MTCRSARVAGLAVALAALILAAPAVAVQSPGHPSGGETKKYAKLCGAKDKAQRPAGADKCIAALRKLASGKSASVRSACAGLSHKRAKRARHSPFARCVKAASKLEKQRTKAGSDAPAGSTKTSGDPVGVFDDGDAGDPADILPDDPHADLGLDDDDEDRPVIDPLDLPVND